VPLPPEQGQQLLVKSLQLPLPKSMTEALGIHQSDIIIRSAIIAGIADMRANPWLLDIVFASLAQDKLTMGDYGEQEIAQAKKWFLKTDIPVFMNTRIDEAKLPAISIALQESVEQQATLGDVHYMPQETTEADWPALAGPFAPLAYNAGSGIMKLPADVVAEVVLVPGMVLVDRVGRVHPVLEVLDADTVAIKAGTIADFGVTILKGAKPQFVTTLESLVFRETYSIGLWAQGEAVHLTYLYSIVDFVLLRYKEALLEARGFETSTISWSNVSRNEQTENELVFTRFCNLTGLVRQYWPKVTSKQLELQQGAFLVGTQGTTPPGVTDSGKAPTGDESWLAEQDALLVRLK
jgi:hypothetical protein